MKSAAQTKKQPSKKSATVARDTTPLRRAKKGTPRVQAEPSRTVAEKTRRVQAEAPKTVAKEMPRVQAEARRTGTRRPLRTVWASAPARGEESQGRNGPRVVRPPPCLVPRGQAGAVAR